MTNIDKGSEKIERDLERETKGAFMLDFEGRMSDLKRSS